MYSLKGVGATVHLWKGVFKHPCFNSVLSWNDLVHVQCKTLAGFWVESQFILFQYSEASLIKLLIIFSSNNIATE